ncbi:phosphomannomutase/phosphoglucomutase [Solirubrobacter sp. CPCC 204708]|uniref:Phosphomannomutase/phosphoglucomutase n=1 Tax=Solirubrobacter deserti TaxID=2282478 RepID=A0ABT4RUZ8_9ACTN|nr:phosphomannomutase/phosphoglucomutase [Solirubrobacter deserti]MBE2314479.1 phosphomannomutase/phosphoglucomutase [Solirubrobacter deserti]MDA0142086.1 phosphomannomutase/phosphoglucomutase [Solirubrobacter deserti]
MAWPYLLPRSGNDAISYATDPLDPTIFREYDVRGKIDPTPPDPSFSINPSVAGRVARAFGTWLQREHGRTQIVVGFDGRSYSEPLANAVCLGLLSTGMEVVNIGLATSPLVYFAQHTLGWAGVSVTASHNPNGWSGFKLAYAPSKTLVPDQVAAVKALADERDFATGNGTYVERSFVEEYLDMLVEKLPAPRALKVVVDGANSISAPLGVLALERAGYDVVALNGELDWTFPNHEPDPEAVEGRVQLQEKVLEVGADVGVALDGDGDRLGVTDERGGLVFSDTTLAILAQDVLERYPGAPVVYDVKCSRMVADVIGPAGGDAVMWKTGHSHIKAKMQELGAPFAGERSGHFFYGGDDYFGYDDAIYSALRFLHVIASGTATVSERVAALPRYVATPTMNAFCPDTEKYRVVEEFGAWIAEQSSPQLITINGVRAEWEDAWVLVRASSNLPALVLVVEATTDERLREVYGLLRDGLARFEEVGSEWENDPFAAVS